ncbi:MAG: aromatic ring-hydroxylating dioxygenase subunit alpha [Proteobacteria bacterium]|nr:aromatic ring-hydroxylating dioxygenase subunit alpha [Pseudomonadota bacterium]
MALTPLQDGFAPVRRQVPRANHAPGDLYASAEIFAREKQQLFLKDWILVAREEELEAPGDYMTFRLMGEPFVVTRTKNGALNAFANVCAHRGVEVASGAGNAAEFSCPYHGWLYDLEGKLVGAPYMEASAGFNPAACRLKPLQLAVWRRSIFVNFAQSPVRFDDFIAQFEADFGHLHPERCRLAFRAVIDFDCNWKLLAENLMDMYHVGTLHAGMFGAGTTVEDAGVSLHANGGMRVDYESVPMAPGGSSLFGNMPWLADRPASYATMGYLQPNTHIVVRSDNIRQITPWPIAPDKCRVVLYCLFPEVFFEDPEFADKVAVYREFTHQILGEDSDMVRSLQHAMTTRSYQPGRLAALERPIHHVINGLLDRLFDPD